MNGHDFTREQNMEARMTLAAARRGLANGWKTLNFYKREVDSGLHRP